MNRRPRKSITIEAIADHWQKPMDRCWRCWLHCPPSSLKPERAHIVDRAEGGLDGPQNMGLLCSSCHRGRHGHMPIVLPEYWHHGIEWVMPSDPGPHHRLRHQSIVEQTGQVDGYVHQHDWSVPTPLERRIYDVR